MSIVKNYQFKIKESQRVQIHCESNFSVEVLEELIALRPIEVSSKMVGDECTVNVSLPQGLAAVVLSEEEDFTKAYFADIESTLYNRLNLGLNDEEQAWYIAFSSVYGTSIGMLATKPIVIKFFESYRGHSILFGADEAFRVINARDSRFKRVVSDPSKIPDALLRLVEVIDDPLPENRISLERLEERVRTTKKLLDLYTKKQFSLEVKEEIRLSIAELQDFELKVQAKIEETRFGPFGFEAEIFSRVTARFKQITGTKRFEQVMGAIYKEVMAEFQKRQASESFAKEGNIFERILDHVESYGVRDEVLKHLNGSTSKGFLPLHCCKCSGEPVVTKCFDNRYKVNCKDCGHSVRADFLSKSRGMVIHGWNRQNTTNETEIEPWLTMLRLEIPFNMNDSVVNQYLGTLRNINRCLTGMMAFWKKHVGSDASPSSDYANMMDLLEMIKFVCTVIRERKKAMLQNKVA